MPEYDRFEGQKKEKNGIKKAYCFSGLFKADDDGRVFLGFLDVIFILDLHLILATYFELTNQILS